VDDEESEASSPGTATLESQVVEDPPQEDAVSPAMSSTEQQQEESTTLQDAAAAAAATGPSTSNTTDVLERSVIAGNDKEKSPSAISKGSTNKDYPSDENSDGKTATTEENEKSDATSNEDKRVTDQSSGMTPAKKMATDSLSREHDPSFKQPRQDAGSTPMPAEPDTDFATPSPGGSGPPVGEVRTEAGRNEPSPLSVQGVDSTSTASKNEKLHECNNSIKRWAVAAAGDGGDDR